MYKIVSIILLVFILVACNNKAENTTNTTENNQAIYDKKNDGIVYDKLEEMEENKSNISGANINKSSLDNENMDEDASDNHSTDDVQSNNEDENEVIHLKTTIPVYKEVSQEYLEHLMKYDEIIKRMEDNDVSYDKLTKEDQKIYDEFFDPGGCSWYCSGVIHDIFASSTLEADANITYEPQNIIDGHVKTAWVEGTNESGIGESISFQISGDISYFIIYNGYVETEELFYMNNRVKKLGLLIDGELKYILELFDTREGQIVNLDYDKYVFYDNILLTFEIMEVYSGWKYDDTCISEIEFLGGH